MLKELIIRNFAIVDRLRLTFGEGLNVITGETGAGKSIIVNAIKLLTGERASTEFIKPDTEGYELQALLEPGSPGILSELQIPHSDKELIIRRVLLRSGKGRAYINDSLVTIQTLSALGSEILEIQSQHEHQKLFSPALQREFLDRYGGHEPLVREVEALYNQGKTLKSELNEIREKERERTQRIDMLRYQIEEIDSAGLDPAEKGNLLEERKILMNLHQLKFLCDQILEHLKGDEGSITDRLGITLSLTKELSKIDDSATDALNQIEEAHALVGETVHTIRELMERYDLDPARLEEIESRLLTIEKLERKYGDGIEEILRYRNAAAEELDGLLHLSEKTGDLEEELNRTERNLGKKAEELSRKRKKVAEELEGLILRELRELAFQAPAFHISISPSDIGPHGLDRLEFLFSANPDQPPRPLHKVASGGEISRVMLGLKSVFADIGGHELLIFDEVDAGIGGETAESVAEKLKKLSADHQIICITHLPQIASRADHHLMIRKVLSGTRSSVEVKTLQGDERKKEIARMMSGEVTDSSLQHAEELLQKS